MEGMVDDMAKTVPYNFFKEVDGMKVYKRLLEDKYIIAYTVLLNQ